MVESVPALSIAGMVASLIIAIGLPIALAILARKKLHAAWSSLLIGAGVFIVFALILEQILHTAVFAAAGDKLLENTLLYALYGGAAAGIFEETGRYIAMRTLMKRKLTKENAIMYGIGHGGIEAILIVGVTMISNIAVAIIINAGSFELLTAGLDGELKSQVIEQLSTLWTTPSAQFFMGGVERLGAIVLQICLSYIVYRAVKDKKPALFILAIALHFAVDAATVLLVSAISVYAFEAIFLIAVALIAAFVYRHYKAESDPAAASAFEPATTPSSPFIAEAPYAQVPPSNAEDAR